MRTGESAKVTLEQIDLIRRLVARYPDDFELALTADEIQRIDRAGKSPRSSGSKVGTRSKARSPRSAGSTTWGPAT